ncbi:hypothetical protein X975_09226, partial [Stegodyphus mimosarum]
HRISSLLRFGSCSFAFKMLLYVSLAAVAMALSSVAAQDEEF